MKRVASVVSSLFASCALILLTVGVLSITGMAWAAEPLTDDCTDPYKLCDQAWPLCPDGSEHCWGTNCGCFFWDRWNDYCACESWH